MFVKITVFTMLTLSLTGCLGSKPFQPHPPIYAQWTKDGLTAEGVKQALRQCGYIDILGYGGDKDSSINDHAQRENCMFKNGFKYKDGYRGLCASIERKNLPACQSNAE